MPATPETAATGTLLAELVLAKPCGVVADKNLTFSAITQDSSANADGVAGYALVNTIVATAAAAIAWPFAEWLTRGHA